jgi:hypothetical protein
MLRDKELRAIHLDAGPYKRIVNVGGDDLGDLEVGQRAGRELR